MIERLFVEQGIRNIELDKYLKSQLNRAGFTKSEIVKTPLVTRIVVNVTSPGLAIGKGGQTIRQLTEEIKTRFKIDNPQLEIREIPNPNLDAQAVVDRMASLISRGFSWRSVVYRSLRDIRTANALGAEIIVKGVIGGKGQRKRKRRLAEGYMKKVGGETRLVEFGKASARTKIGNIGLKVRIVRPEVQFLDKINLKEIVLEKEETKKETTKEETAEEKSPKEAEKKGIPKTETKKEKKEKKKEKTKTRETKAIATKTKKEHGETKKKKKEG